MTDIDFIKIIKGYLQRPDVEYNNLEISLYEFTEILNSELKELREIVSEELIIKDINKTKIKEINKVRHIIYTSTDKLSKIYITFKNSSESACIIKEKNKEIIPEKNKKSEMIMNTLKGKIENVLNLLEDTKDKYKSNFSGYTFERTSQLHDIIESKLNHFTIKTRLSHNLKYESTIILDEIVKETKEIKRILKASKNHLLKKIPIDLTKTNEVYKEIIYNHKDKNTKIR